MGYLVDGKQLEDGDISLPHGQQALRAAHGRAGLVLCMHCPGHPALYVYLRGGKHYALRRIPGGAGEHTPECKHGKERNWRASGKSSHDISGIRIEDGMNFINLRLGFNAPAAPKHGSSDGSNKSEGKSGKSLPCRTSLAAALVFFLDDAGLSTQSAPRVSWDSASSRIREVLAKSVVNGHHAMPFTALLRRSDEHRNHLLFNQLHLDWEEAKDRCMLSIGLLAKIEQDGPGRMKLSFAGTRMTASISCPLWRDAVRRINYPDKLQAIDGVGGSRSHTRLLLIARVSPRSEGGIEIMNCDLVVTNRGFVVVESSHELEAFDRIVSSGVTLFKPLRPLPAVGDWRPDFLIKLPNGREMLGEVAGFCDQQYVSNINKKLAAYLSAGYEIWVWWAGLREKFPALEAQTHESIRRRFEELVKNRRVVAEIA